jgi:hypothetical protein
MIAAGCPGAPHIVTEPVSLDARYTLVVEFNNIGATKGYFDLIAWDAEDDPDGNYQHIVAGEVTAEEVEEVLSNHDGDHPDAYSETTANLIIFGTTATGKRIAVVYSDESVADLVIIRPVSAYPVQEYGG